MNIGTLTIEMAANVARLQKDMETARKSVEGVTQRMRSAAELATTALGALGVGLSIASFTGFLRNAINATDKLDELAVRTGVAVEELAGLQLAFQQSGMDSGALQMSMSKLSKAMVDGSDALTSMGLSARNADGSLKSTRQMLGEVADKFNTYEDGAGKAALAIELFGKSGTDMLPLLAEGSEGLAKFDEMARALGLTMSTETAAQAGKFNDTVELLGMGLQGVGMQVAAQLLPTLQNLAGQFLESMTKGDALRTVADGLSVALKGLYSVGVGLVSAFSAVGKTLGAAGAQLVAVLSGDFKTAAQIGAEWREDMKSNWADTADTLRSVWTETGNSTVAAFTAMGGAAKDQAPNVKRFGDVSKKAAEDQKKAEKEAMDAAMERRKQWLAAHNELMKELEDEDRALQDAIDAWADRVEAVQKDALAMTAATQKQRESNAMIGKSKVEIAIFTAAKYRDIAALNTQRAATADVIDVTGALGDAYRQTAREALDMAEAIEEGAAKEALVDFRAEQEAEFAKTWDQIGQGFVDALMEGGKSVKEYLIGLFRTMVLRPMLAPLGGMVSTLFGGGASAAGLGGGGGGGGIGGIGNVISAVSSIPGAIASGFAEAAAGASFVGPGIGLAPGATGIAGSFGSALAAIPGWGWALAGIGALFASGFGKTPGEQHSGAYYSSTGKEANMENARAITAGGGWDDGAWARDLVSRPNAEVAGFIGDTVDGVITAVEAMGKAIGVNANIGIDAGFAANTGGGKDPNSFGYFNMTVNGELIEEYVNRKLGTDLPAAINTWTTDMLDAAAEFMIGGASMVGPGETATQTLTRLANTMAALKTPTEQFAAAQANLREKFGALGMAVPRNIAELRTLIESTDTTTEAGRQLNTQLISLVPAFAQVSAAVEQAFNNISATTAQSVRSIQMSLMTDAEQYAFLNEEIAALTEELSTATLPADIERIFNQINANTNTAFGLLSEEDQQRLGTQFIDALYEAEALAQSRLDVAGMQEDAADMQAAAVQVQADAAQVQQQAADGFLEAVNAFRTVVANIGSSSGGGSSSFTGGSEVRFQ